MTIAAFTPPAHAPYPPFINISEAEDGKVRVSLRANPTVREGVHVCGFPKDRGQLARCTPGDENCNNYCNMAPQNGPMADAPIPITFPVCGDTVAATFERADLVAVFEQALAALKA